MERTVTRSPERAPERMVWNADGLAAQLLDQADEDGQILLRIRGERDPVRMPAADWVHALACDYCDQPATVQLRDGQPSDVLCRHHAHDHYERPNEWVRPIPNTVIRQLYRQCQPVTAD
jgi:hypothetical protein